MSLSRDNSYKIIVIGDSFVGKSCLAYRYCKRKYPKPEPDITVSVDYFTKTLTIDGEQLRLDIWDTAGMEKNHNSMVSQYYRNLQAVVFVYDVNDYRTFANLDHWICKVKCHHGSLDLPKVLVGNQCDRGESQRAVTTEMGREFASDHDMPFFETSALDDSMAGQIDAVFMTVARKIKDRIPAEQSPPCPENRTIILNGNYTPSTKSSSCSC